jgi:hypothetical protein
MPVCPGNLALALFATSSSYFAAAFLTTFRVVSYRGVSAMSDGLTGMPSDWIAIWRAAISARGWTHRDVDSEAQEDALARGERWGDGYCGKLLCGAREPTATTISRMNRVLGLRLRLEADTEILTP